MLLHRPEQPSITYLTLALSFSIRLKFILNAPAQLESGGYLNCVAFVLRDSLLSSSLQERGFPEVADWLTVQWSFIVKSWEANGWELADEWFQCPLQVEV